MNLNLYNFFFLTKSLQRFGRSVQQSPGDEACQCEEEWTNHRAGEEERTNHRPASRSRRVELSEETRDEDKDSEDSEDTAAIHMLNMLRDMRNRSENSSFSWILAFNWSRVIM